LPFNEGYVAPFNGGREAKHSGHVGHEPVERRRKSLSERKGGDKALLGCLARGHLLEGCGVRWPQRRSEGENKCKRSLRSKGETESLDEPRGKEAPQKRTIGPLPRTENHSLKGIATERRNYAIRRNAAPEYFTKLFEDCSDHTKKKTPKLRGQKLRNGQLKRNTLVGKGHLTRAVIVETKISRIPPSGRVLDFLSLPAF